MARGLQKGGTGEQGSQNLFWPADFFWSIGRDYEPGFKFLDSADFLMVQSCPGPDNFDEQMSADKRYSASNLY